MTIEMQGVGFAYGPLEVLRDVTATARPGRVTAVLGPNAAGKSTLLRCAIGGLRPGSGAVLVDGRAAHAMPAGSVARRIAYVPQRPSVAAAFTVRQVVALGRYALRTDHGRVDAALERLELGSIADRPYPQLSVGQQQRVAMARAVAQLAPDGHLVLDEPTAAMDLRHAHHCFSLFRALADEGVTVLVAMHDLSAAAAIADDAWLMDDGRLVAAGLVDTVFELDRLEAVFGVGFSWSDAGAGRRVLVADPPGAPVIG